MFFLLSSAIKRIRAWWCPHPHGYLNSTTLFSHFPFSREEGEKMQNKLMGKTARGLAKVREIAH